MEQPGRLPSIGSHRVRHDWSDLAVEKYSQLERLVKLSIHGQEPQAAEFPVWSDNPNLVPYLPLFHCLGQPFHIFPTCSNSNRVSPHHHPQLTELRHQRRTSTSSPHCTNLPAWSWACVLYSLFLPIIMDNMSIYLRPSPPLCALELLCSHPPTGRQFSLFSYTIKFPLYLDIHWHIWEHVNKHTVFSTLNSFLDSCFPLWLWFHFSVPHESKRKKLPLFAVFSSTPFSS